MGTKVELGDVVTIITYEMKNKLFSYTCYTNVFRLAVTYNSKIAYDTESMKKQFNRNKYTTKNI